jgi:aspartyl-tRNA(Asn)/glutamyl-tRNA(Gln) amidotransferase subunit A
MLQAIAGYDPLEPSTVPVPVPDFSARIGQDLRGLKMGIPTDYYFDIIDPAVETTVRQAISTLEGLGVEAREVALPSMQYAGALRIAAMADSVVTHEPYLAAHRQDYGPTVLYRTLAGQFVLGRDYSKSLKVQRLIKEEYARVLQDVDFLVTPSSPVAAWRIDAESIVLDGQSYPVRGPGSGMTARCTSPSNATGLPAMSIPCGFTSAGLPIGLQLIGRPFEEALLFQVAHDYEAISPSRDRRPALVDAG